MGTEHCLFHKVTGILVFQLKAGPVECEWSVSGSECGFRFGLSLLLSAGWGFWGTVCPLVAWDTFLDAHLVTPWWVAGFWLSCS